MSERVPAQNKNSATPSQTTQQSSPLFQQRPFTDERYESVGSNSNISKELEGIQPKTIRRSLNWQNISVEAPSRSDRMSLPGGIQRQQEQPAPAIGHQVSADSEEKSALEVSNSTISTDAEAQQPKIARARLDWRNISVEAPSRSGGDASPQPIQRQQETDPKEEKSALELSNSTISTDGQAQQPKIARAGFNWRNISIEAPSLRGGEAFAGAIQRASEEEKKDIDLKPEAPAIGRQVSGSTEEKSALELSNSTISTDGQAQQPKIARASFNWRNISIEAPSRGGASSTYPGGIQRLETSDEKEGEESTQSLQMQSEGAIQAKCSECEQQEKEEQNNSSIQTKLTVGAPGDKYEQEADSMAAKVMTMPDSTVQQPIQRQTDSETEAVQMQPLVNSITPLVQRSSGEEEEVQMKSGLQRASDGSSQASSSIESRLASYKGGGSALPDDVRSFMEPRFGADFSSIKVHTDSNAVQMNKELGAQAFAHGSDIYFGAGKSPGKDELTAHELTHTIQQTGGVQLNKSVLRKPKPEEEQKQPLQAKKISSKTPEIIQNKLTTGIAAQIQAKADPGQILEQLKNTQPTNAPAAYGQAQATSAGALEAQKQQLQQSLPKIPAPTGLPAQKSGSKEAKGKGTAAAGNKEVPAAGATKQKSGQAAKASTIQVKDAPPPRPIKPTQLAGGNGGKPPAAGNSGAKAEQAAQSDPQLARSAQNELASVRLDSSQVSTKLGKAPTVDITGEADPSQMDGEQRQSNEQVRQKKAEAAKEINQDFGENNIFPEDSKETLQASKALSAAKALGGNKGKVPTVPSEVAGNLNQSLAPALKERIGAEQQKYTVGKQKFDRDTAKAKTDSDKEIAKLNQETSQKQLKEQKQAKSEVQASKQEWQTELGKAEKDYQDKAGKATQDQKKKIDREKQKGEQEASKHIAEAEKKAEQEKQKAEKEADQKKEEKEKESGGFLGWVKSAATAVIDGLKKAVNFIYDNLRKAVKFIFEQAIKLATAVIDLARKAIVGLIQGLGTILKGLVNVVFAAFPEIAKKINSKIDQAIKAAVKAVNAAADLLKKGVTAALNFLAKTLDTLLAGIQALYNAAFDAIGKVIEALRKLLEGLGNLVAAAKQMPGHFMGQLSEEVLGMNLTEPLAFERSKEDCAKCDTPATAKGGDDAALLNKTQFAEDDFATDQVANFDVNPEFVASLNLQEGGEVEFGESNHPANSMEAIKAELAGGETEGEAPVGAGVGEKAGGGCCDDEQTAEAKLQELMAQKPEGAEETQKQGKPAQQGDIPADMKTIGPLSVGQRAKYMSHQMIQGVKQWFSANWPKLLAGAIAALAAFVGLNILTGGAITAALPALMQVVAVVMGGVALANIAGHIGNYLSQGWAGNIGGAAKSLARGLAAGAVELVFALLFNAGAVIKALKSGLQGTAKAVAGAAKNAVKTTVKSVKELGQIGMKGAKTALKNGKIMLQGVKGGFAKGAKSLDDIAKQLVGKLRFNKFKIRRQGLRIQLLGHINPWVLLADGTVVEVDDVAKNARFGDEVSTAAGSGKLITPGNKLPDKLKATIEANAAKGKEDLLDVFGVEPGKNLNLDIPSAPDGNSYITYVFKDADDNVVYVGKASYKGTPQQALDRRISRGHDHYSPELKPEIVATQSSKAANAGAEEFFKQAYQQQGTKLTNIDEALDMGRKSRRDKSITKMEKFIEELDSE